MSIALDEIALHIRCWLADIAVARKREGLDTDADTLILTPHKTFRVGQLRNWASAIETASRFAGELEDRVDVLEDAADNERREGRP